MSQTGQHGAEAFDKGAFPCARHAGDSQSHCLPGMGQQFVDHMFGNLLMRGQNAFDQRNRPGEHQSIRIKDALDVITGIFLHS